MSDAAGSFRAIISTLSAVDADKDVTLPGAFENGKSVVISAYGHSSWRGTPPIGVGVINSDNRNAWVSGQLFDTPAGRDMRTVLKALGPLGQWSYGYEVLDASFDPSELAAYPGARRLLKRVSVFEASPVLVGAGVGTGTTSIKKEIVTNAQLIAIAERVELAKIARQLETQMFQNDWRKLTERVNQALAEN